MIVPKKFKVFKISTSTFNILMTVKGMELKQFFLFAFSGIFTNTTATIMPRGNLALGNQRAPVGYCQVFPHMTAFFIYVSYPLVATDKLKLVLIWF